MAIDIVDLTINSIVIFHSYGNVYQKVITVFSSSLWGIPQQTVNHTISRKCGCVQVCPIEKDASVFGCTCSCIHFRVTMSPSISLTCTIWQARPHVSMPFNHQTKLTSQLSNPLPGICRFSLVMGATWFVKLTGFHSWRWFLWFSLVWQCFWWVMMPPCFVIIWYLVIFDHVCTPCSIWIPQKNSQYLCSDYRLQHRRWIGPWETWSAIVWEVRTNETIRRPCRPRRNGKHRE